MRAKAQDWDWYFCVYYNFISFVVYKKSSTQKMNLFANTQTTYKKPYCISIVTSNNRVWAEHIYTFCLCKEMPHVQDFLQAHFYNAYLQLLNTVLNPRESYTIEIVFLLLNIHNAQQNKMVWDMKILHVPSLYKDILLNNCLLQPLVRRVSACISACILKCFHVKGAGFILLLRLA